MSWIDIFANIMLGGGILAVGLVTGFILSVRRVRNAKVITVSLIAVLTALARMMRDRNSMSDESNDILDLLMSIEQLAQSILENKPIDGLTNTTSLTTSNILNTLQSAVTKK